jgi:predicted RNA-binding Zn-ribbon protein involved in translation (DUF1610 family)
MMNSSNRKVKGQNLLPCPFCGEREMLCEFRTSKDGVEFRFGYHCESCGCYGPKSTGLDADKPSRNVWNMRYSPSTIEKLRDGSVSKEEEKFIKNILFFAFFMIFTVIIVLINVFTGAG